MLVMKVGHHFDETWNQVVERKLVEKEAAGVVFWGYGGSACHPTRQVQPFARASSEPVEVALLRTASDFVGEPPWADAYSVDETDWQSLPSGIRTSGKWALILDRLELVETGTTIDLGAYEAAIGRSEGKLASSY